MQQHAAARCPLLLRTAAPSTHLCSSAEPLPALRPQAFSLFMLRDVQRVADPKFYTSLLAMVGQLSAAAVALPAGRLSDQLGRKPLVYASCALMGAVYVGFTLQPSVEARG